MEIDNQQLGLANNDAKHQGVMGLGPGTGSSSPEQYPTIVENMAARGHITRAAFSMYLVSFCDVLLYQYVLMTSEHSSSIGRKCSLRRDRHDEVHWLPRNTTNRKHHLTLVPDPNLCRDYLGNIL